MINEEIIDIKFKDHKIWEKKEGKSIDNVNNTNLQFAIAFDPHPFTADMIDTDIKEAVFSVSITYQALAANSILYGSHQKDFSIRTNRVVSKDKGPLNNGEVIDTIWEAFSNIAKDIDRFCDENYTSHFATLPHTPEAIALLLQSGKIHKANLKPIPESSEAK